MGNQTLENQTVVVIGGTSGIGLATAVAAQQAGAKVWAVSRSADKVSACQKAHPGITFSQLDVHDAAGLKSLFESIGAPGTIDHIAACATGAERTMRAFMDQTDEQFREAFNKFWGYTNVARQGIPFLAERGSLTFVSGSPARKCNPGMSSVSTTGCAVEGFTRALAVEVAPKRVNVVAPGLVMTGMHHNAEIAEKMGKNVLLGRIGQSEEIASALLLCMSNTFMTGATIDVDGGALLP